MELKNLWGDLGVAQAEITPNQLLRAQAKYLEEGTGSKIKGKVTQGSSRSGDFVSEFLLAAPELNNYEFSVCKIVYPPQVYPLDFYDFLDGVKQTIHGFEGFEIVLERLLDSAEMKKVIRGIIAHVNEKLTDDGGPF